MATAIQTYKRIKADPADWFEPEEVKKAKDYQRPLTIARVISLAISAAFLLVVLATEAARRVADATGATNWVMRLFVIVAAFTIAFELVALPISIWTTFRHEKTWGFSTETPRGFVMDMLKSFVLGKIG